MARKTAAAIGLGAAIIAWSVTGGLAARADYTVKPPDIVAPKGAAMGQVRRITRPFAGWTLICDENLTDRSKVCNVTQAFVDGEGSTVFSWSLAASEDGKPLFILRVAPTVGAAGVIKVRHPDGSTVAVVPIRACDDRVCVATMRLGSAVREQIALASELIVSFEDRHLIQLNAPLAGLKEAVAAVD